jgi:hypothetical protein
MPYNEFYVYYEDRLFDSSAGTSTIKIGSIYPWKEEHQHQLTDLTAWRPPDGVYEVGFITPHKYGLNQVPRQLQI